MATKTYLMEKLSPAREILPCQAQDCEISTNKRYRSPAGVVYVACCFDHAEAAYLLELTSHRKAMAVAAA